MIRLGWKDKFHAFVVGRLGGNDYYADEGYVTQLLEMGRCQAVPTFDRVIQDIYLNH